MSSDFYYEISNEILDEDDCRIKMNTFFGNDYKEVINMAIDGHGPFIPGMIVCCPFFESRGNIFFSVGTKKVSCSVSDMNAFCYYFKVGYSYSEYLSMYDLYKEFDNTQIDYKTVVRKSKGEDGQAKICLSTLVPLVNSSDVVHILVIGSSSEDDVGTNFRAGRTYEMLLDFLPRLGYKGSITLFDKYEYNRKFVKEGFDVVMRSEYYDYNRKYYSPSGEEFTHIFDDVFVPTIVNEVEKVDYNRSVLLITRGTDTKFSYAVRERCLYIQNNLINHIDMVDAIGGGYMKVERSKNPNGKYNMVIYGSSNRVGHYDEKVLIDVLSPYYNIEFKSGLSRGRLTFDPESKIFSTYPNAIISCKHFGEELPVTGKIYNQIWYDGYEQRFVFNSPEYIDRCGWRGCGCRYCEQYAYIINGIVDYKGVGMRVIINMLNSIIYDKCIKSHGSMLLKVRNYIESTAHSRNTLVKTEEYVCKRFGCSKELFLRVVSLLGRVNDISVGEDSAYIISNTKLVNYHGEMRYYLVGKEEYYRAYNNKMVKYDKSGKMIVDFVPDYRPRDVGDLLEKTYSELIKNFLDVISSVVGFKCKGLRGTKICGFTRKYIYYISRDKSNDIILSNCNGWYLKYNKEIDN